MSTPEHILKILRQRQDMPKDDKSKDAQFVDLSPHEKLNEVCAWHLGDTEWGTQFIQWAKDCGFEVKVKDK